MNKKNLKKILKIILFDMSGLSFYKWNMRPPGLYCFNYHRIGDPKESLFDPNIFSCTKEKFDVHMQFYKKNFNVISMDECVRLIEKNTPIKDKLALITFDDGYLDNYEQAFPILKKYKLPATFFIPTDYVNSNIIPWWDQIAWMIKQSKLSEIKLNGWKEKIQINQKEMKETIRLVLKEIKKDSFLSLEEKIRELETKLEVIPKFEPKTLFMNWDQIKDMSLKGMSIEAHSCSHQILSQLSIDEQRNEIQNSKNILESKLERKVQAFAYPVGGTNAFTKDTMSLLEEIGYKVGFNNISGINQNLKGRRFNLNRFSFDENASIYLLKSIISSAKKINSYG